MASPRFDNLHLLLSRKIGDAVSTAATDGLVTSALRTDYLNKSNRFIRNYFRKDLAKAQEFLQGLCTLADHTFAADGVSVPTDYAYFIELRTPAKRLIPILPEKKFVLEFNTNKNLQSHFVVLTNKIYAYLNGSEITSGTGKLLYLKTDTMVSNGNTIDIAIDDMWLDCLVSLAAMYHELDKGQLDFATVQKQMSEMVLAVTK